jgi:hypothetical protein
MRPDAPNYQKSAAHMTNYGISGAKEDIDMSKESPEKIP